MERRPKGLRPLVNRKGLVVREVEGPAANLIGRDVEEPAVLEGDVAHIAIRLPEGPVPDMEVTPPRDHPKEPLVVRAHAGPPHRRRTHQAPGHSPAVLGAHDALGFDLAFAIESRWPIVRVVPRNVAHAADELRGRVDRALHGWRRPNRPDHVGGADAVRGVILETFSLEIGPSSQMHDGFRLKFPEGFEHGAFVEQVARDGRRTRRRRGSVQPSDLVARSRQRPHEMPADEARAAGDQNPHLPSRFAPERGRRAST